MPLERRIALPVARSHTFRLAFSRWPSSPPSPPRSWAATPTGSWFLGLGALALSTAALVTRIGPIPINQRIQTWSANELPPDAVAVQQRWWTLHIARSILFY